MSIFKIYVNDRNYSTWSIIDSSNFEKKDIIIDPVENKLFLNDIFTFEDNKLKILHSTVRSATSIPAVLILVGNKTYGRVNKKDNDTLQKRKTTTNKKLYYKCIPDDMRLPIFLVPYEIKNLGFSKVFKNLYVTILFNEWNDKHPIGKLGYVIGPVDVLNNFYEYQLYCKSLNASIQKFQKDTSKALETKSHEVFIESIKKKFACIEERTNIKEWHIFSIDPPKSGDYDDAFSICDKEDGIKQISIYISNVTIWLDVLNLWDSFSRRISTIYLPDKKRPMLPTILSDCLCSLQENVTRIALVMDVFIKDNTIIDIKYSNALIKVYKNYCYEEKSLLQDDKYHELLNLTINLSKKYRYISNVRNSNEMVCYLMIFMNYHCAIELLKHNTGIFRTTTTIKKLIKSSEELPDNLPEEVSKFIKIWNSSAGSYIDVSELKNENTTRHELLDMDAYIHITSPIRRLVDLLNIIKLQKCLGLIYLSENVEKFYDKWLNDLEYINTTMRSIRKVQNDCTLLDLCNNNPDVMTKKYNGYLFEKMLKNDGLYQYIVFLPDLKLSSRITMRECVSNYECKRFKLYLFNDEEKFKMKIRLQMVE
jgi:hypothetical protein